MTSPGDNGLDVDLMRRIIVTWDVIEAGDPEITLECLMATVCESCGCECGDISDALIWAGRMV